MLEFMLYYVFPEKKWFNLVYIHIYRDNTIHFTTIQYLYLILSNKSK